MKLIGLTGGIGSGKSTVAEIFRTLDIPVYKSDTRAKELMNTDPEVRNKIISLFGIEAYDNELLNRTWIAERVFKDNTQLTSLNAIVHPAVKSDALAWANSLENANAPYVIKESAILFEEDLTTELDAVILVVAPEAIRIDRVMKRDQATAQQIKDRMVHQWPDERKIPLADFVIFNDGERSLIDQVKDIDKMIRLTVQ